MPKFSYKARDRAGKLVKGKLDAPSTAVLKEMLRTRELIFIEAQRATDWKNLQIGGRAKPKELVLFARQLAVLISATVPIVRALRILARQTTNKRFQQIVTEIADEVDGGARLSVAMHNHPKEFDDFFVYMIRAGETTGRLDEVLEYLADQKEKDYQLRAKIIGTMIYPVFIVGVLVVIFVFMMIFVIPKLLDVVTQSGADLPFVTKILIGVSNAMTSYWWAILIVLVALVAGFFYARSQPAGRQVIDRLKLMVPIIGNIFRKIYLARMGRSLSNLLAAGVPINQSITIVSDVVGNSYYRSLLRQAVLDVEGGRSISQSLGRSKYIPPMMVQMIAVGEETGRLDSILAKIADFYTNEVATLTDALVSLVEPMIFILLGGGALILVAGIMLPIYQITNSI
jgi:type II secretory pathway component PulF